MRIPTTIDVLTRSIVCACATFSFSRFSFFFPSPPASLFHPLRSVTNTQSRRCPYRKSPTHRGTRRHRCVCLAAWATPPNRVSSADQLTKKCTVHLHLHQPEPWITIHLWKFHQPVFDTNLDRTHGIFIQLPITWDELFRYSTRIPRLVNHSAMNRIYDCGFNRANGKNSWR